MINTTNIVFVLKCLSGLGLVRPILFRTKFSIMNRLKKITTALLLLITTIGMTQSFPYEIELEPFVIPGLDGVHSYAAGQSDGKWVIISGRVDGMHRGGGNGNNRPFPAFNSNKTIYIVDPVAKQVWTDDLSSLSTDLQDQMSSTNTSFYQDGDDLYIIGGYGENSAGNHVTYSFITAIDVPSIINNIINGNAITGDFIQLSDNRMTIAGGQLGKIDDFFYLVGGMELQARYTQMVNPTYSSEMRKFKIVNDGTTLTITDYSATFDDEFHRRDYNMIGQVFPDLAYGYMVSSGVFTPSDGVYYNPIEIDASGYTVIPESTFKQEFSHYQSAKLAMYNAGENEMHSIFFGGIAQYYYDDNGNKIDDSDVPFVKTISRVTRMSNGAYSESVFSTEMPVLVGAGSELFLDETLPMYAHHIIDMNQLSGSPITVGYIFGGLLSGARDVFPGNTANSSASDTIYRVNLVNTTLPLNLVSFRGEVISPLDCNETVIQLKWNTSFESQVDRFEIERGKYGNFERVGVVAAKGNSFEEENYFFVDEEPLNGRAYYRLKMIDLDGSFTYSDIELLEGCQSQLFEIAPNPTNGHLFITGKLENIEFQLIDANGGEHSISTSKINNGLMLDMSNVPSGTYYLITNIGSVHMVVKN